VEHKSNFVHALKSHWGPMLFWSLLVFIHCMDKNSWPARWTKNKSDLMVLVILWQSSF